MNRDFRNIKKNRSVFKSNEIRHLQRKKMLLYGANIKPVGLRKTSLKKKDCNTTFVLLSNLLK